MCNGTDIYKNYFTSLTAVLCLPFTIPSTKNAFLKFKVIKKYKLATMEAQFGYQRFQFNINCILKNDTLFLLQSKLE
jgi:hypothetical protein